VWSGLASELDPAISAALEAVLWLLVFWLLVFWVLVF
jgi:hypothetical protein